MRIKIIFCLSVVALTACSPKSFQGAQQVTDTTAGAVGCASFESKTWDALNTYLTEQKSIPDSAVLKQQFKHSLKNVKSNSQNTLSEEGVDQLTASIDELYRLLLIEAPQKEQAVSVSDIQSLLAALELGDRTSLTKIELQNHLATLFAKIKSQAQGMDVACETPETQPSVDTNIAPVPETVAKASLPVFGSRFAMATAYQSCQALNEPIMDKDTPDAEGIKVTGLHADGVGSKRIVSDDNALIHTHPYYKNVNTYGSTCTNTRGTPLIYDYGGRPAVTSSTTLSFFKNEGSGTSVLGVDCSGFIYTAIAAAGLRLAPSKNVKASGVLGISSYMFIEPQSNGMGCFSKISVNAKESLRAGDVVAVQGHVIMIDTVGADPFGINAAKTTAECAKLEAKNFDFAVIQSSPSKNGVGINRYQAKDYLYESDKMRAALEKYAYYACLAKVGNKTYTPNLSAFAVIRHKLTSECLGTRVQLAKESCIQSCPQLN